MNLPIIPDISFYQDNNETPQGVDFATMRTHTHAVIIRAGQGSWLDPDFFVNWQNAKNAGLQRGAYWFYDSRTAPKQQADLFLGAVKNDKPEYGLWMDFEESYKGNYASDRHMRDFAQRIEGKASIVGVYTGYYWWENRITWRTRSYWKRFPLWIAAYPKNTNMPYKPLIPRPFPDWSVWQFTDRGDGKKYGAESSRIDLNYTKI